MLGYPLPDVLVDFVVRLCPVRQDSCAVWLVPRTTSPTNVFWTSSPEPPARTRVHWMLSGEGAERRAAVGDIGELVVSMSEEDEG